MRGREKERGQRVPARAREGEGRGIAEEDEERNIVVASTAATAAELFGRPLPPLTFFLPSFIPKFFLFFLPGRQQTKCGRSPFSPFAFFSQHCRRKKWSSLSNIDRMNDFSFLLAFSPFQYSYFSLSLSLLFCQSPSSLSLPLV